MAYDVQSYQILDRFSTIYSAISWRYLDGIEGEEFSGGWSQLCEIVPNIST